MTTRSSDYSTGTSFDPVMIRHLFQLDEEARHKLAAVLATCDATFQQMVLEMIGIVENPEATVSEKARARATIDEAFETRFRERAMGRSLHSCEIAGMGSNPDSDRILEQMDSQEAAFAEALRQFMKTKGITQKDLANRIGCTQPAISQMLNRKCRPQRQTIFKLAEAIGVTARELWPDLDVADILDTVAAAQQRQDMSPEEADAYRRAMEGQSDLPAGKPLPKLRR